MKSKLCGSGEQRTGDGWLPIFQSGKEKVLPKSLAGTLLTTVNDGATDQVRFHKCSLCGADEKLVESIGHVVDVLKRRENQLLVEDQRHTIRHHWLTSRDVSH